MLVPLSKVISDFIRHVAFEAFMMVQIARQNASVNIPEDDDVSVVLLRQTQVVREKFRFGGQSVLIGILLKQIHRHDAPEERIVILGTSSREKQIGEIRSGLVASCCDLVSAL